MKDNINILPTKPLQLIKYLYYLDNRLWISLNEFVLDYPYLSFIEATDYLNSIAPHLLSGGGSSMSKEQIVNLIGLKKFLDLLGNSPWKDATTSQSESATKPMAKSTKPEQSKIESKLRTVSGFVKKSPQNINVPKLGFHNGLSLDSTGVVVKHNKVDYVNLHLIGELTGHGSLYLNGVVCIELGRKPDMQFIIQKLEELLSSEFPGSYEIMLNRYLFRFQLLPGPVVTSWFKLAKSGNGTIIDYSWLAPLQQLKGKISSLAKKQKITTLPHKPSKLKAYDDDYYGEDLDPLAVNSQTVTHSTKKNQFDDLFKLAGVKYHNHNIYWGTSGTTVTLTPPPKIDIQQVPVDKNPITTPDEVDAYIASLEDEDIKNL